MMINREDSFFVEFVKTILPYKWSIIFITLTGMLLSALKLYLTPSIYEAKATIEVKTNNNKGKEYSELNPLGNIYSTGAESIDQELAILQTFYIHNKAIDKLNLAVQYFEEKRYKKSEIFSNPPIEITNLEILKEKILGKDILLIPQDNNFTIEIKDKYREVFEYGKEIETKWFKCVVVKKFDFKTAIYFRLNGNNRNIYERIVKKSFKAVRVNKNASLIKLTYQDTSPKRATKYLDNLMSIYIKQSIINKSRRNNKVLEFINKQLISIGKALKESETELERFRIENNIIEPTKQSQSLLDRLSDVEVKLSQTKIEKALIDTVARKIKRDNSLDSITPTLRELGDEPTIRVIEHLQRLQRKLNELSVEFTPKHPEIIAINRDIWRSERTIQKNIKELQKNIAQKQKSLYAQKRKYENSLKTLPTKEKRLIDLQRNHQVSSKMYSYLLEKQAENKMKKVATVPDYKIIDPAYSNGSPIKPKRSMSLAISTIFSMIFASLFAYMRSSLNNRLQNIKEIRELTNLPLYAELPILENSKFLTRDSSQLLKSFRNLRTKINFNHPKQKGNVILITSSKAREGKTNIVSNLGYIFQKANYKTLIIDFDLYRPQIHNIFSLGLNVGTGEYLSAKESDVDKLIQKTKYKDLDILTAGSITEDVSELILSRRLYFLLETLKKRYNYIFIDAIPLSIEADVLYIMKYSDVNLITVQEEFTKKSFITGIQKHIGEYKFKNIAILAITNS